MENFSVAIVGEVIVFAGKKLKVALTTTGCKDCSFQTDEGARFCQYSAFCFAHNRPDKNPVKFVRVVK